MSFRANLPSLDALERMLAVARGRYTATPEGVSDAQLAQVSYLANGGRPFASVTPELERRVAEAMGTAPAPSSRLDIAEILDAGAEAAKRQVLLRWSAQGAGVVEMDLGEFAWQE